MDNSELSAALGEEISFWRRKRGLSREELAAMVGSSSNTVGRWERGDTSPDVPTTWAVARALGIDFVAMIERVQSTATMAAEKRPVSLQGALLSVLQDVDDADVRTVLMSALGHAHLPNEEDERAIALAIERTIPLVNAAVAGGLVTGQDVLDMTARMSDGARADALAVIQEIALGIAVRRRDRQGQAPTPPPHVLAANDPGKPSQYEKIAGAQDDAYDINQDLPELPQ